MFLPSSWRGLSAFPSSSSKRLLLSAAFFFVLVAACSKGGPAQDGAPRLEPKAESIVGLSFNVWKCEALECMDLETIETSTETYTACAAVLEDAHQVGVELCQARRGAVVSRPAQCEPLGMPCPMKRSAYQWDSSDADGGASTTPGTTTTTDSGASP